MAASFEVRSHPCNGSLHAKAVFERAQARFNAGSPALGHAETSAVSVAAAGYGLNGHRAHLLIALTLGTYEHAI
jgi:hypothetical protein